MKCGDYFLGNAETMIMYLKGFELLTQKSQCRTPAQPNADSNEFQVKPVHKSDKKNCARMYLPKTYK